MGLGLSWDVESIAPGTVVNKQTSLRGFIDPSLAADTEMGDPQGPLAIRFRRSQAA